MHLKLQPPLHICHIVDNLNDLKKCRQILENLTCATGPDYEHTLVVLSKGKGLNINLPANTTCLELNFKEKPGIKSIFECQRALRALKPDLCQTYGDIAIFTLWLARRSLVPATLHSLLSEDSTPPYPSWFRFILFRFVRSSIDFYTVPSEHDASWLTERIKVKKGQILHIPLPINIRRHSPPLREVKKSNTLHLQGELSIPSSKFLIGISISNMEKEQAFSFINDFICAKKRSTRLRKHAVLLLLGNTHYLPELRIHIDKQSIPCDVCYIGFLKDYAHIFMRLDAFVHLEPADKQPHKPTRLLLEAMAMGLPVISQRTQRPSEKSLHPINWSLQNGCVHIQEQLIELLNHDNKRLALGRAAREYVKNNHCLLQYQEKIKTLYCSAKNTEHHSPNKRAFEK